MTYLVWCGEIKPLYEISGQRQTVGINLIKWINSQENCLNGQVGVVRFGLTSGNCFFPS